MPSRNENLAKLEYFSKFLNNSSSEILGNKSIIILIFDDEELLEINEETLKIAIPLNPFFLNKTSPSSS